MNFNFEIVSSIKTCFQLLLQDIHIYIFLFDLTNDDENSKEIIEEKIEEINEKIIKRLVSMFNFYKKINKMYLKIL